MTQDPARHSQHGGNDSKGQPPVPLENPHQVDTAVGTVGAGAAGAVTGALVGSLVGPAGTVVGAAIGAVAGAVAGSAATRLAGGVLHPNDEEEHWQNEFADRPYFRQGMTWQDYGPAYRLGWESRRIYPSQSFEAVEPMLEAEWHNQRGASRLDWLEAREPAREAWMRITQRLQA